MHVLINEGDENFASLVTILILMMSAAIAVCSSMGV